VQKELWCSAEGSNIRFRECDQRMVQMFDVRCHSACHKPAALQEEAFSAQKELAKLRAELALAKSANLASGAVQLDSGARMLVAQLDGADNKSLQVLL